MKSQHNKRGKEVDCKGEQPILLSLERVIFAPFW